MTKFIENSGTIIIGDLVIPKESFLKLEAAYSLPDAYIGVEYSPGEHHYYMDATRVVDMKATEWIEGDGYIANIENYRLRLEEFNPITPIAPTPNPIPESDKEDLAKLEEELALIAKEQADRLIEKREKELPDYERVLGPYLYGNKKTKQDIAKVYTYLTHASNVWLAIKNERNYLLKSSDWTVLPDIGLSETDKDKWIKYRQDLRDFPNKHKDKELLDIPALTQAP